MPKAPTNRESIKEFIKENDIKDVIQLNMVIKQMTGALIEEMLEVEREAYLGYPKHKRKPNELKENDNSRNGYTPKTVRSSQGDIRLDIPRDRKGDFQPELIRRHENDISGIEDKIISMYARGMSVRDIQSHLEVIYGASISTQTISNMTDSILPAVEEWRNRGLKPVYSIVYIDGQRFKVRSEGVVKDKTVYTVLAIDLEGHKDLLGLWISETESVLFVDWLFTNSRS